MFVEMNVMDWIARARDIMQAKRITQIDLATKSGYSYPGLNRLLNGKRGASLEALTAIANALDTTVDFLKDGIDRPNRNTSSIPLLDDSQILEWIQSPENIRGSSTEWLLCPIKKAGAKTFAYTVVTDEMAGSTIPMFIPCGAIAYVDPNSDLTRGSIAFFLIKGQAVIREAVRIAGEWMLSPSNAKYPAIPVNHNAKFIGNIIGVIQTT